MLDLFDNSTPPDTIVLITHEAEVASGGPHRADHRRRSTRRCRWLVTLRTAFEALNGRRMRTLLTMLGILIGIAAVMLTVGLGEGAKKQIGTEIAKLGSNLLIVMPGSMSADSSMTRGGGSTMNLTLDDAELISTECPDVAGVAPMASTARPRNTEPPMVDDRDRHQHAVAGGPLRMLDGRFFTKRPCGLVAGWGRPRPALREIPRWATPSWCSTNGSR